MTFNQQLTSVTHTPSAKASLFSLAAALNGSDATENKPEKPQYRNLAWQIAPNLLLSFKYAWAGIRYAFVTQRNFRIHTIVAIVVMSLAIALPISLVEVAIMGLTCTLVMVLELLNTALESVVDLTVQKTYHELAKVAKDCAAGAVLLAALSAVFVGSIILFPPLFKLIFGLG